MSIITSIWRKQPGDYFCISTKDPKSGEWKDRFFARDQFDKVDDFIEDHSDLNLYFCPHGFTQKRRLEKYAAIPKLLWADLDECDPRKLNGTKPNIAWESSPGRYAAIWTIDQPMTKRLNKSLTYSIGADKGGWDLTQVLRIPGTRNYKYGKNGAPGKLLWRNQELISVSELQKHIKLQDEVEGAVSGVQASDAAEVYKKYEKRLPSKVRQAMFAKQLPRGTDRSKMLWTIGHALIQAGATREEWFCLIKTTIWNKFADRPKQLEREYEKILAGLLPGAKEAEALKKRVDDDDEEGKSLLSKLVELEDVEAKPVDWIIPGWVPVGMLTLLEGDPGIGKSWISFYWAFCLADGTKFPTHYKYGQKMQRGSTLYLDLENDPNSVTRPRMNWIGFDPQEHAGMVTLLNEVIDFSDPDQLEQLEAVIKARKKQGRPVKLLVVDTIAAYMGAFESNDTGDVATMLTELTQLAVKYRFGLVLLRHVGKNTAGKSAVNQGLGSVTFGGNSSFVHRVAHHPTEDGVRIIKTVKARPTRSEPALKFTIEEAEYDPDLRMNAAKLEFQEFDPSVQDEDIGKEVKKEKKSERAKKILQEMLSSGSVLHADVEHKAQQLNIDIKTFQRALQELGGTMKKMGSRGSVWILNKKPGR